MPPPATPAHRSPKNWGFGTGQRVGFIGLPLGLVDIKVAAVDEIWSGLKLVIRKELR